MLQLIRVLCGASTALNVAQQESKTRRYATPTAAAGRQTVLSFFCLRVREARRQRHLSLSTLIIFCDFERTHKDYEDAGVFYALDDAHYLTRTSTWNDA